LHTEVGSKLTSSRDLGIDPGDEGVTLSRLAPIGKACIKDITVEAKSMGEFIDEDVPVTVVRVEGYNVVVKPKEVSAITY
jgi:membrane-bound ClpP family serine protease